MDLFSEMAHQSVALKASLKTQRTEQVGQSEYQNLPDVSHANRKTLLLSLYYPHCHVFDVGGGKAKYPWRTCKLHPERSHPARESNPGPSCLKDSAKC